MDDYILCEPLQPVRPGWRDVTRGVLAQRPSTRVFCDAINRSIWYSCTCEGSDCEEWYYTGRE